MESGAVNRVVQPGQSNGETGRDPLRINSGEAQGQTEMNAMTGGNGHMMSPGQEHMRHHGAPGAGPEAGGDLRQPGGESR